MKEMSVKIGKDDNVHKKIKKNNVLKETFGTHKFSKPTEQMMKETDKELYDI